MMADELATCITIVWQGEPGGSVPYRRTYIRTISCKEQVEDAGVLIVNVYMSMS